MATTARISNIENSATEKDLATYFQSKGLSLSPGHHNISFTNTDGGYKLATVSFIDRATFKRALALPYADRILNDRTLNIDDSFDGFTVLSEGTQVEWVLL